MQRLPSEWGIVQPGDYVADHQNTVWHVDMIETDDQPRVHLRSASGEQVDMPLPRFDRPVVILRPTEKEIEQMIENFAGRFAGAEMEESQ